MTLREIAMYCKIKQSKQESDEYKQQANLYESVLTGDVTEFIVPSEWKRIREGTFHFCVRLTNVVIPNTIKIISSNAFANCTSLTHINIPDSVTYIGSYAFNSCINLTHINIPDSVTDMRGYIFKGCTNLTSVILDNGFNCNGLDLSASTKYSVDTLAAMLTALADRTGQTAYTLTLGTTNLAKLSDEQKAIATDKNWTLA